MDIKPVPAIIAAAFAFSVLKDKQTIGVEPTPIDYSKFWLTAQKPILKDGKIARFEDYTHYDEQKGITIVGVMKPYQPTPYKHVNLRYTNLPKYPFHTLFIPHKKSDGTWTTATYSPTKEQGGVKTANPLMLWPGGTLKEAKANVDSLYIDFSRHGLSLKGKIRDVNTNSKKSTIDIYAPTEELLGTVRLSDLVGEQNYTNNIVATTALQKVIYGGILAEYLSTEEWK